MTSIESGVGRAAPAAISRGADWFLNSGIQDASGGVARYYLAEPAHNAPISTEITGYALSALLMLNSRLQRAELQSAASRAADYLCRAWDETSGAMPFECPEENGAQRYAYFFDCGIIARGLLRMWRETGAHAYLQAAYRCGESMLADFLNERDIHPIVLLPGKTPRAREERWSRSPGCYQLKPALAWLELAEITRDQRFQTAWDRALDWALATHTAFCERPAERNQVMDRLHAYSYFLEGLTAMAGRDDCETAMADGLAQAARLLREIRPEFVRADVCAQLLRARLYAHGLEMAPLDREAAGQEAEWAAGFQIGSADPRFDGGFWFGEKAGELLPYVNPVSASFCLQALDQWHDARGGQFPNDWHTLI